MILKLDRKRLIHVITVILCILMVLPLGQIPVKAASTVMEPHVLKAGDKKDQMQTARYSFTSDGQTLIPIKISENGSVVMSMRVENGSFVIMKLYSNASADSLPESWSCQCTGDMGNRGTTMRYFDKGTYYVQFPANTYEISMVLYPNKSLTAKSGTVYAGYADYRHPVYYQYKALKDGYLTIKTSGLIDTGILPDITLCDSKKNPITDSRKTHDTEDKVVYAIKKNKTYQVRLKSDDPNGSQYYQFSMTYKQRTEKSGDTKSKAVSLKLGESASGLVFAEDKTSKSDWYKVTITKKQKVVLYYSGSITSGSMMFDVYDSKGKNYASYSVVDEVGTKDVDDLNRKGTVKQLPKGTYYIRVRKSGKTASGIYTIRLAKG